MVTQDLFPGGDLPRAEFWTGLRPMTPDSTPLIGATRWAQLYLNTGHGTLGWTMACGSARVAADLVLGRPADIRTDDLGLQRYVVAGRSRLDMPLPCLPPENLTWTTSAAP